MLKGSHGLGLGEGKRKCEGKVGGVNVDGIFPRIKEMNEHFSLALDAGTCQGKGPGGG